jgi:hypothetical protein
MKFNLQWYENLGLKGASFRTKHCYCPEHRESETVRRAIERTEVMKRPEVIYGNY